MGVFTSFSIAVIKYPYKSNLREKGFVWPQGCRLQIIMASRVVGAAGHILSMARKEREMSASA